MRSRRSQQIDVVRALSVIAIALFHSAGFGSLLAQPVNVALFWQDVAQTMTGARLPVVFALSGYLTSARVSRGWRGDAGRRSATRVLMFLYIYALWLALAGLLGILVGGDRPGWTILSIQHFARLLVEPVSFLWFIWALAAWSFLAPTLARLDQRVVAVALVGLSVWAANHDTIYPTIAYYGLFHMLGVWARPILERHPARVGPSATAAALVALVVLQQVFLGLSPSLWSGGLRVVRDVVGICCVIGVARLLCRMRWVPVGLAWVGRRTLSIFVLHYLLLALILRVPAVVDALNGTLAPIAPLVLTVTVVLASIALYEACLVIRAGWLFDLPGPVRAALGGRASSAPSTNHPGGPEARRVAVAPVRGRSRRGRRGTR